MGRPASASPWVPARPRAGPTSACCALQAAGIEPDLVCGTSIGAFVGAAWPPATWTTSRAGCTSLGRTMSGFFDVSLSGSPHQGRKTPGLCARTFLDGRFAELQRPFACVATDLASGRKSG